MKRLQGVAKNIASGQHNADHVQRVAKLKSAADAEALLTHASIESPEDLGNALDTCRASTHGG
jgi:hypothetical protein